MKTDTAAELVEGFARRYRLTKTDEYSSVFGFRRAFRGTLFLLHYRPREEGSHEPRLGLVVGKKLVKTAVGRNLIKRLARERFRRCKFLLPPCDIVLRLAVKPGKLDRKAVAAEIEDLFRRFPGRYQRQISADPS